MKKQTKWTVFALAVFLLLYYAPAKPASEPGKIADIGGEFGIHTTLMIDADGTLVGWGGNRFGLINGKTPSLPFYPFLLRRAILKDAVSVAGNYNDFMIVLDKNGTLWGMGRDYYISLPDDAPQDPSTGLFRILDHVVQADIGISHILAIKDDGSLWGLGADGFHPSRPAGGGWGFVKLWNQVEAVSAFNDGGYFLTSQHDLYLFGTTPFGWFDTPVLFASDVKEFRGSGLLLTTSGDLYDLEDDQITSGNIGSLASLPKTYLCSNVRNFDSRGFVAEDGTLYHFGSRWNTELRRLELVPEKRLLPAEWSVVFGYTLFPLFCSFSCLNPVKRNCLLGFLLLVLFLIHRKPNPPKKEM